MITSKRLFFVVALLVCFFLCNSSNAQRVNQFDENKQRTGVWKKYYPNKRIRYVGEFKNGKEVGVFKFYDITNSKQPVIIKTFYEDSDSLFVQFYSLKGTIETEGVMHGRSRVGNWKFYDADGTLMSEENYRGGKLDGEQLIYYKDGKVTEFAVYKDGLKDGVFTKYASNGNLIEEITYKKGKPNGLAKYFELNGTLKETGHYKDGRRIGTWEYYIDGELATAKEKKKDKSLYNKYKEN